MKSFRKLSLGVLLVPVVAVLFLQTGSLLSVAGAVSSRIPADCGEVICRSNENGPSQLFIIGLGHRDALTRSNGIKTTKVQKDVFQIGDWLIHREGVGLLLPEGYFASRSSKVDIEEIKTGLKKSPCSGSPEMKEIVERLADERAYVNAEMLLHEKHVLKLRQVEDEQSYFAVRDAILKLSKAGKDSCDLTSIRSELDYLQERRTADLLQRIPGIVNDEFRQGNIKAKKAIFTIGLAHVRNIVETLNKGQIEIPSPSPALNQGKTYRADLNLQKENFSITVIIPRTLVEDRKVLEMTGLEKIVAQSKNSPIVFTKPHL